MSEIQHGAGSAGSAAFIQASGSADQAVDVHRSTSKGRFEYLPVGLFGSVMGLTGLSVAWHLAAEHYGAPAWISGGIGSIAVIAFVAMSIAYLLKLITAPEAVRAEFRHPIAGNLFGTISISLLLLPIILAPVSLLLAQALWAVGAVSTTVFAWVIVSRWMSDRQQVAHATPAWFIPMVGMLDIPLALPALHLPGLHGVMVLGLAVGLFFAVPLFTLVFSRLVFEAPLPDALLPSLVIMITPFAVGYSTYVLTTGQNDIFSESLYTLTLFVLAVLLGRLRNFLICCPFKVSWWAVSFPLAASAITTLRYAAVQPNWFTNSVAILLLGFVTLVIVGLFGRTLRGIINGELRHLSS